MLQATAAMGVARATVNKYYTIMQCTETIVEVSQLSDLQDPDEDHFQNVTICSLSRDEVLMKICSVVLCEATKRQTDRQTDAG